MAIRTIEVVGTITPNVSGQYVETGEATDVYECTITPAPENFSGDWQIAYFAAYGWCLWDFTSSPNGPPSENLGFYGWSNDTKLGEYDTINDECGFDVLASGTPTVQEVSAPVEEDDTLVITTVNGVGTSVANTVQDTDQSIASILISKFSTKVLASRAGLSAVSAESLIPYLVSVSDSVVMFSARLDIAGEVLHTIDFSDSLASAINPSAYFDSITAVYIKNNAATEGNTITVGGLCFPLFTSSESNGDYAFTGGIEISPNGCLSLFSDSDYTFPAENSTLSIGCDDYTDIASTVDIIVVGTHS